MMRRLLACVVLAGCLSNPLHAQRELILVGSEIDEYVRFLELQGKIDGTPLIFRSLPARSLLHGLRPDSGHLWSDRPTFHRPGFNTGVPTIQAIYPLIDLLYNSKYARSANDGALWAGKGLTGSLVGGFLAEWGPLTATFLPTLFFSQNNDFEIEEVTFDRSQFAYPWHVNIDWPQRFGDESLEEFDLGQSGIRLDLGGFTAAISTENMWWGPAFQNPIIMGNSAPGFPHVDLGTGKPVSIGIGALEVRAIWGELSESDYFDTDPVNDRRYITGLTLGYKPSFLPGLTIGGTRVLYQTWPNEGLGAGEIFDVLGAFFVVNPVANDLTDQLLSLVARWVMPESGFEAYVEWARGDFSADLRDLLLEPDYSRAYTLGFQKLLPSGDGTLRLRGEFTTLGSSSVDFVRLRGGIPSLYVHSLVIQGYTHRGHILGAAIGPGGQSQYLGIDRYTKMGRWGVFIQRVRFNDDFFQCGKEPADCVSYYNRLSHDVELTFGASLLRFVRDLDIRGSIELSRRLNWHFLQDNDVTNVKLSLRVGWRGN